MQFYDISGRVTVVKIGNMNFSNIIQWNTYNSLMQGITILQVNIHILVGASNISYHVLILYLRKLEYKYHSLAVNIVNLYTQYILKDWYQVYICLHFKLKNDLFWLCPVMPKLQTCDFCSIQESLLMKNVSLAVVIVNLTRDRS